jgi:hypothetical protein
MLITKYRIENQTNVGLEKYLFLVPIWLFSSIEEKFEQFVISGDEDQIRPLGVDATYIVKHNANNFRCDHILNAL